MSDLTKGVEFTNNEQVTATKLNNLVDDATINTGAVGSDELAVDAVTTDKVQDGAITRDKLAEDAMGIKSVQRFSGAASGNTAVINLNTDGNTVDFSKTSVSGFFTNVYAAGPVGAYFQGLSVNESTQEITVTFAITGFTGYYYIEVLEFY